MHEPVRDRVEQDRGGLPGHEVPEEVAGPDEEILDGVDRPARGHDLPEVQRVDDQVPDQHDLADRQQPVHEPRRHRHVHPVQLADPQEAEHGRAHEHVAVEHAVETQVEAARRGESGAGLEVVDAREAVLLHEAVLMVPGGDQQQQGDGRELQPQDGEADDHHRSGDEAVPEAIPDVGHAVGAHPSGVVVGDRDPEVDRCHRHIGKPGLEAQRQRDGEEGQAEEPDDVRSAIQDIARLEHAAGDAGDACRGRPLALAAPQVDGRYGGAWRARSCGCRGTYPVPLLPLPYPGGRTREIC